MFIRNPGPCAVDTSSTVQPGRRRRLGIRVLLGTSLLLIIAGLAIDATRHGRHAAATTEQGDAALYRAIDTRMADGQGYYRAAAAEQRRRGFPIRPFVAIRMPARAWVVRLLGGSGALHLAQVLAILAVLVTALRLRRDHPELFSRYAPLPAFGPAAFCQTIQLPMSAM